MVFGELGKFPVTVSIKARMLSFWMKLCSPLNSNKLSFVVYKCLLNLYFTDRHKNRFLSCIENTLNDIGLSNFWIYQGALNVNFNWFKEKTKRCLKDQYLQSWYSHVDTDDICFSYRMFKNSFGQEPYISLLPYDCVIALIKFRTTNNALPVNKLRFNRIVRNERLCTKCDLQEVGDEFHYLFVCPYFLNVRNNCLTSRYFRIRPNVYKFNLLFSTKNKKQLIKLKHFVVSIEKDLQRAV